MSCLKVSSSSPAWLLLEQSARRGPHPKRLLNTHSIFSRGESRLQFLESWYILKNSTTVSLPYRAIYGPSEGLFLRREGLVTKSIAHQFTSRPHPGDVGWSPRLCRLSVKLAPIAATPSTYNHLPITLGSLHKLLNFVIKFGGDDVLFTRFHQKTQ